MATLQSWFWFQAHTDSAQVWFPSWDHSAVFTPKDTLNWVFIWDLNGEDVAQILHNTSNARRNILTNPINYSAAIKDVESKKAWKDDDVVCINDFAFLLMFYVLQSSLKESQTASSALGKKKGGW